VLNLHNIENSEKRTSHLAVFFTTSTAERPLFCRCKQTPSLSTRRSSTKGFVQYSVSKETADDHKLAD